MLELPILKQEIYGCWRMVWIRKTAHLDMNVDFQKISWYLNVVRSGRQQVRAKG
jgi:hypothetical protein